MAALVEFDVAEACINCNVHPDRIHRQLSSSRLANGRLHAYHSVIAMSLLHPALLILTLFIVLRLQSMKIKLPLKFHQKRCRHSFYGADVGGTTRPQLTLKTVVVMFKKFEMYLLVVLHAYRSVITISRLHPALLILTLFIVLHIQLMLNFQILLKRYHLSHSADVRSFKFNFHHKRCHHSYKTTSYRSRPTLKTTVVMLGYAEKDEMYLLAIIHQRLIISGDVELNPGPLGELKMWSVTNELVSVMAKWYHIGVQLGVDDTQLEKIEKDYQETDRRFSEVIKFWLRGNTSAAVSWKSLVEVLETPFVREKGLAKTLRQKGGMVVSETAGIPGTNESEVHVQPQEINGGQRGKKRSVEEKLDDSGDHHHECQGDPEAKKARLATGSTGYMAAEKIPGSDLLSVVGGDVTGRGRGKKRGSSSADSAIGTSRHSVATGATFTGISQFSEDIMLRDFRDENYLRMEAKLRPTPDDSSGLELDCELDSAKQMIEDKELNPLQGDENGNNALHLTAIGGHLPVMKYWIEDQRLNPACQGWKSRTPLHYAARYKHLELVKYLIGEQQVDPLCQDEEGCTPLHAACEGGDIDVVQYLISEMMKHTSPDSIVYDRTKNGNTAVHHAALMGHLPVIKLFIMALNFNPNTPDFMGKPPLLAAVQGGHLEVVRYLTEELQCDPSYAHGEDEVTPLHAAAAHGRLNIIRYLTLTRRCNPLPRDSYGDTPLHEAAGRGQYEAVMFFISELKCDPNTPGQWGMIPLHHAARGGHLNIVYYLIGVIKCNPASLDGRKITPLHLATMNGHLHVVKYLIEDKHCNPLCLDDRKLTPLLLASMNGHLHVVKYLIEDKHYNPL